MFIVFLAPAACNDVMGPGPDVEMEVTLSRDVANPGENVTILITVHNRNPHAVSLGLQCVPLGFRVIDDSGHRVGPAFNYERTFACIGEIDNTIPAQGSKTYSFLWAPFLTYGSSNTPLPQGTYQIFAGFAGEPLRPPFSNRATIHVGAD